MASAQVLPNSASSSRKQGHLEAGKRRLEEFRKRKAEGRAKKVASTDQLQAIDISQYEKQPQESEHVRLLDSDGAVTSESDGVAGKEPPGVVTTSNNKASDSSQITELGSSNGTHASPPVSANNYNAFYADPGKKPLKDQEFNWYDGSGLPGPLYANYDRQKEEKTNNLGSYTGTQGVLAYGVTTEQSIALNPVDGSGDIDSNIHQYSYYPIGGAQSKEIDSSAKEYSVKNPGNVFVASITSEKSASVPVQNEVGFSSMWATDNISTLHEGGRKLGSSINHQPSKDGAPWQSSESLSTDFNLDYKGSSNHVPPLYSAMSETGTRRTRPSFLDSLTVPRVASVSHLPFIESEKTEPSISKSSKVHSADILLSSASQQPFTETVTMGPFDKLRSSNLLNSYERPVDSSVSVGNEGGLLRQSFKDHNMERKHEFRSVKQDEDFAALEQHIEDLTQEKFSLQRALDASRALAESLSMENSSLTDSFNQQGAVVNQLRCDMERLQEEIRAQLLELESVKMGYANAQLECNAADERAKILASEVIGLEEKALRLRSNELKLERQLENSNAEITSYKKKVSSLEKERQELQLMIDALQEEKKLLQSKLRKASASGKSIDVIKTPSITKDVSTSTEDLGVEVFNLVHGENSSLETMPSTFNHEMQDVAAFPSSNSSTFSLPPENRQFNLPIASAAIPPDQLRMIGNINSLISELSLEKEELMQNLASETTHNSKLKDLNNELSRKLEAQTQRLELLTAQSMANENTTRPTDSRTMHDSTPYTDEGDEVVERVLGWIMKLFPGGPSKRRTSKLL